MTLQRTRADNLPEGTRYPDTGCPGGCDISLKCDLPLCIYDNPGWHERAIRAERNRNILRLRIIGQTALEIAANLGISSRTVYRVLSGAAT